MFQLILTREKHWRIREHFAQNIFVYVQTYKHYVAVPLASAQHERGEANSD